MIKLKIPATTANLGPGFDHLGMALSIYNYVTIREETDNGQRLDIRAVPPDSAHKQENGGRDTVSNIPTDGTNLIYRTLCDFYALAGKPVPPISIRQEDYIPMTRGLGSSAACVAAGLLAGNVLTGKNLSRDEIINLAAQWEGHPDNTTPALAGGLIVGVMTDQKLDYMRLEGPWENLLFALLTPGFMLSTEKARAVLPEKYPLADVVFNASRSALLVAALMSGDFSKLSSAMEDRIHQPYRRVMVPGMEAIMMQAKAYGAYNVFLSGAGPALIAVTEDTDFVAKMMPFLANLSHHWDINWVRPDRKGAEIVIA